MIAAAALALAFAALAQDAVEAPAKGADPVPAEETAASAEQGNNKADLATTARIRKEINAANNLSENAKSAEVIT